MMLTKKYDYSLFGALLFLIFAYPASAQHKLSDISLITIDDFKGVPPKNSTFPIYTNSRVFYRIDTVMQKSEHKFKVRIKTKVEMYHEGSFWNTTLVKMDAVPRMLNHEQGHFYIAHIAANKLEKELPSFTFTENWKEEVNKRFHELNRKFGEMDVKYDKETMHGRNLTAQKKWDTWIREQLYLFGN